MTYCFDLDGTLCLTENGDYENAYPLKERIDKVNKLSESGHTIIIETARGSETGIDWSSLTHNQMNSWGLKFDKLRTGKKIYADFYIDDKGINIEEFFDDE